MKNLEDVFIPKSTKGGNWINGVAGFKKPLVLLLSRLESNG
jgi:hypothetical protein